MGQGLGNRRSEHFRTLILLPIHEDCCLTRELTQSPHRFLDFSWSALTSPLPSRNTAIKLLVRRWDLASSDYPDNFSVVVANRPRHSSTPANHLPLSFSLSVPSRAPLPSPLLAISPFRVRDYLGEPTRVRYTHVRRAQITGPPDPRDKFFSSLSLSLSLQRHE